MQTKYFLIGIITVSIIIIPLTTSQKTSLGLIINYSKNITNIYGGGSGESKWIDGGDFIYPNNSFAGNIDIRGYINSTDWSNVTINISQILNENWIEDSQEGDLNVNSSDYWDDLNTPADILGSEINNDLTWITLGETRKGDGIYIYNDSTTYTFNETKLNVTIDDRDDDTTYTENSRYLDLVGTVFTFLESVLNATIDERDSDTTYSDLSEFTDVGNIYQDDIGYDCGAGDYVYGVQDGGTLECRADEDTTYTEDSRYLGLAGTVFTLVENALNATIGELVEAYNYITAFDQSLNTTDNVTFHEIVSGRPGYDGNITIYSEQGATDRLLGFLPHASMSFNTIYTWPQSYPLFPPAGNVVLSTDTNGNMDWITIPSPTLYVVFTTINPDLGTNPVADRATDTLIVTTKRGTVETRGNAASDTLYIDVNESGNIGWTGEHNHSGVVEILGNFTINGSTGMKDGFFQGVSGTIQSHAAIENLSHNLTIETRKDTDFYSHSTTSNAEEVTVLQNGWYKITYSANFDSDYASRIAYRGFVQKDGTDISPSDSYDYSRHSTYARYGSVQNTFITYIEANSVIELMTQVMQDSGNFGETADTDTIEEECWLLIERI